MPQVSVRKEPQFWDSVLGLVSIAIPEAIETLSPAFSGQSFETLVTLNLGHSDSVPKPTGFETCDKLGGHCPVPQKRQSSFCAYNDRNWPGGMHTTGQHFTSEAKENAYDP
jgi:hypothetical protein